MASLSASIAPPTAPPTASRLRSDDYRAWDKFDVDKALDELEKETDEISHNDQPTDPGIISEINQNDHEEEAEVLEKSLIEKEKV